ncbi:MAG: TIGR03985 family CRISPR-associated protein, partial [Phormidium sp.]
MAELGFVYPPSPQILQWLAAGQLANRFARSVRLWVLLKRFYHPEFCWRDLPQAFSYTEVRSHLFALSHPQSNQMSVEELVAACHDSSCVCHQPFRDWIFTTETNQEESVWRPIVMQLTGLSEDELEQKLLERPFATVHRSIRDDLKQLQQMGWLKSPSSGKYQLCEFPELPTPPTEVNHQSDLALSKAQVWELLRVLEAVAFV